ncbi:MAG: histidine ammonia-lyase [Robiginitomaculum sp.]
MTLILNPAHARLSELEALYRGDENFALSQSAYAAVDASARRLSDAIDTGETFYGVNTGFGKLASVRIDEADLKKLQRNLVLSHASGVGEPLSKPVVRLLMALKILSLGRGASGIRRSVIAHMEAMIAADIIAVIPAQGSVGASGDLAPLAHMAMAMIGEGDVFYGGKRMAAGAAFKAAKLTPITLAAKEGLALLNGTQVSTALALVGLFGAWRLALTSLTTGALSVDAAMGSSAPFTAEIHSLRGHQGQIDAAHRLREWMKDSEIRGSHASDDERVQDPYCLRCMPQVIGACLDSLRHAGRVLEIEANAVTDNPLILSDGRIVSGGNFHAEPVALVADLTALAIAEIGAISQRRIALLVDPALSFGLPSFLAVNPGVESGFMVAEVTSAALMSENKALATPRSTDSTPTSANQEDHVSMACHAARRLTEMNKNLAGILAIEAMAASQGIGYRTPLKTSSALAAIIKRVRETSPVLTEDRSPSAEIIALSEILLSCDWAVQSGAVTPIDLAL